MLVLPFFCGLWPDQPLGGQLVDLLALHRDVAHDEGVLLVAPLDGGQALLDDVALEVSTRRPVRRLVPHEPRDRGLAELDLQAEIQAGEMM